jgi:hypothetical protein
MDAALIAAAKHRGASANRADKLVSLSPRWASSSRPQPKKEHMEETWNISPEAMAALNPQPANEIDELIDSAGCEWPVKIASWSEPL